LQDTSAPAAVVQVQITVELLEKLAGIRPKPSAKQQQQQQQLQQRQKQQQQQQQLHHLQPGRYVVWRANTAVTAVVLLPASGILSFVGSSSCNV